MSSPIFTHPFKPYYVMYNPNKTISANSKGIVVSFGDVNKHKFVKYESVLVQQIQLYGTVKYQKIEHPGFNPMQEKLYAEAMYGLNFYTAAEIKVMPVEKKRHVIVLYTRVQKMLNMWKQEIIGKQVSVLINLEPREIKGILSQGMILMAENSDGNLSFVAPSAGIKNGSVVR